MGEGRGLVPVLVPARVPDRPSAYLSVSHAGTGLARGANTRPRGGYRDRACASVSGRRSSPNALRLESSLTTPDVRASKQTTTTERTTTLGL